MPYETRIIEHIQVLHKLPIAVNYTAGTSMIPISFVVDDFEIPEGSSAVFCVAKPSGMQVYSDDTEVDTYENSITVFPTQQMFIESGKHICQLQVTAGSRVLNSFVITINACPLAISESALESTAEFTAFKNILENAKSLTTEVVKEYVEKNGIVTSASPDQVERIAKSEERIEAIYTEFKDAFMAVYKKYAEADALENLGKKVEAIENTMDKLSGDFAKRGKTAEGVEKRVKNLEGVSQKDYSGDFKKVRSEIKDQAVETKKNVDALEKKIIGLEKNLSSIRIPEQKDYLGDIKKIRGELRDQAVWVKEFAQVLEQKVTALQKAVSGIHIPEQSEPKIPKAICGHASTNTTGRCYVYQEIGTPYLVFIQAEGAGSLHIEEKEAAYFLVSGDPSLSFSWEVREYDNS